MKYSILTTSDKAYFPHLQILANSVLDKCNLNNIKQFYIIDNGLTKEQSDELSGILSKIKDDELIDDINNKVAGGKINSRNYEACKNKLTTMIGA